MRHYFDAGESHLIVEFGDTIDPSINREVHALGKALQNLGAPWLREVLPTYRSLMISYCPWSITRNEIMELCESIGTLSLSCSSERQEVVEIPVLYGGEWGLDMLEVAKETAMSVDEVIFLHTSRPYPVYMIGFLPGYPYLGGLDPRLSLPRLKVPRTKVPAGSVAIAMLQTGVYPLASPGGWRIIGHTPLCLFDPHRSQPSLLRAGQWVRFRSISLSEYHTIVALLRAGQFSPYTELMEVSHG